MRWETVGEEAATDALFDADAMAEHHVGRGEFRGMEFLHVNAKQIISEVPKASNMPFRHTINVYRGCSHACTYCLAGDTPILMGDGRTRPLEEIRPGDVVYGTVRHGLARRYVTTTVLDHWSTVRPAWRVTLAGGTELVAGGDHRFLTERGWAHVTRRGAGHGCGAHLVTGDKLVGPGRGPVEVVSVAPLGVELRLYDITTGTSDFIANGVVSHNCFARPTHEYLGLGLGDDFSRRIVVKVNAVERLRAELRGRRWAGHHIAMGTNTDPYQRCEGKYHLTQGVVKVLGEVGNPFSILTKSTLILRDLELLVDASRRTDVRVNLSIGTLDDEVWRLTEPGTPRPLARVEAVRRLNEAGVSCGVLVAPVLPGLSDGEEQLRAVVEACVAAGAASISSVALHLRPGVREHYLGWLRGVRPELAAATAARYKGAYLPKAEQQELAATVRAMVQAARVQAARVQAARVQAARVQAARVQAAEVSADGQGRWESPRQVRWVGGDLRDRMRAQMGGDPATTPVAPQDDGEQLTMDW